MSGLIKTSTKDNERDVIRHCTCTNPGVHEIRPLVTPALTSNSPFLYANRREDLAVQQKSLELYPKHPSNLLILLETLLAGAALGEFTEFFTIW